MISVWVLITYDHVILTMHDHPRSQKHSQDEGGRAVGAGRWSKGIAILLHKTFCGPILYS